MIRERLLIVDDEQDMRRGLQRLLAGEFPDLDILTAAGAGAALELVGREPVDLALVDLRMPEMDGLELLTRLRREEPELTVIMMTAYGSIELAVEALRQGAYDFIGKPFDKELLLQAIRQGRERSRLRRENRDLQQRVCEKTALAGFVGQSPAMRRLGEQLRTIALTDYTVLVRGESGTGKELAVRAIHGLSKRRDRLLVMVNCPAIPEHLLESELFGHRRGAFTGAERDHPGLFAEAEGGTICLDEIGDIPVGVQSKLLRVLQEQEIKPLGADKSRRLDVRVIASTSRDLERKMAEGSFRQDLFYRLNVVGVNTPPLREMEEDIPLLASHFLRQAACETGLAAKRFSPAALARLRERAWPGNVRELQNFVRQLAVFCGREVIEPEDLARLPAGSATAAPLPGAAGTDPPEVSDHGVPRVAAELHPYKEAKAAVLRDFTRRYLEQLLAAADGNLTRAAALSGLSRTALQKIKRRG